MIYIALENIRSLQNIGAIFRTCSFFDIKNILLVGYSGKTINTKNQTILHKEITKASLGSENDLTIIFIENTQELINFAQSHDCKIVSVEQSAKSIKLQNYKTGDTNTILVFGNEVTGVSTDLLNVSDKIIEIERTGTHNSLNVATTVGIVCYYLSTC